MTGIPGTVGRPRGPGLPSPPPGAPHDGFAPSALSKWLAQVHVPALAVRALTFFALALLASAHWVALIEPTPTRRALVASLVATAGGVLIGLSGRLPRAPGAVVRILLVILTLLVTLTAIGIRFKLLLPAHWGTLGDRVNGGLSGVGAVTSWPYSGPNLWLRLTTLMAAPIVLTIAAALAFWPARPGKPEPRVLRFAALVLLVALYGVAVAARPFELQTLRGLALLACLAAWLWLPRLRGRDAAAAVIAIAIAGVIGIGLTAKVASSQPWVDYRHWSWSLHKERTIAFDWNHQYGPLTWPRKGTTMLLIKAKEAHYWKAETLDKFDGIRWTSVSGGLSDAYGRFVPRAKWVESAKVTVRGLKSDLVIGPGALFNVKGVKGDVTTLSNGTYVLNGALQSGDTYTTSGYTPDPSAKEMRAAPLPEASLARFTRISLPDANGLVSVDETVPLRGQPGSGDADAALRIQRSGYAAMYALAKRVTAGTTSNYDAVRKIGAYLESNYNYSEDVPRHKLPLESFLFQDKRGYCQQFSGAAALMLRMLGIPARVASGFTPGTYNKDTKEYVVRDLDAHSWIEVWFGGIGWVPFDPTPALAPASSQAGSFVPEAAAASAARGDNKDRIPKKTLDRLLGVNGSNAKGGAAADTSGTPWAPILLVAGALILLIAAIGGLAARSRRIRGNMPAPSGDPEVDYLVRLLSRLGLEIKPGTTLFGLERRLHGLGGEEAAEYARRLRRRRFSDSGEDLPSRSERRHLRQTLARAVGAGPMAKLHLALPEVPGPRSIPKLRG